MRSGSDSNTGTSVCLPPQKWVSTSISPSSSCVACLWTIHTMHAALSLSSARHPCTSMSAPLRCRIHHLGLNR